MSSENMLSCKVVLLGETGVGKTSIITKYLNNTFSTNYKTTNGANYAAKSISFDDYEDKTIKFEIWDTAGQERFRALNKIFYKDASIAILVYDITRKNSFEEIKKYWYKALIENANKKIIIGIAANKCDMYENEQVDEEKAREFSKEIKATFKLTSASKGDGIEDLFKILGKRILNPNGDFVDDHNKEKEIRDRTESVKICKDDKKKDQQKKKCC